MEGTGWGVTQTAVKKKGDVQGARESGEQKAFRQA